MIVTNPLQPIVVTCVGSVIFSQCAFAAIVDTVLVGNPGNSKDASGFGAVADSFRMGTYEVTNSQYAEFLNAVDWKGTNSLSLYNHNMASNTIGGISFSADEPEGSKYSVKIGRDHNPVNYVSWYDAVRFANWLHNGQGLGSTEIGAYTLQGESPTPSNGTTVKRNADAMWFLPNENEWYKAAYHKNDGITGNYWNYPTSTDAEPFSDQPPGGDAPTQSNTANFFKNDSTANQYDDGYAVTGSAAFNLLQNYLTDVGSFTASTSPYGTYDQGGSLWEWNEDGSTSRGARGGFWSSRSFNLQASTRNFFEPTGEWNDVGFRVASVPEPTSSLLLLGTVSLAGSLVRRRHRGL